MAKEKVMTSPALQALQEDWKKAKQAETQWREYRLKVEEAILHGLGELGYELPDRGGMPLDAGVEVKFSVRRTWNQPCLAQVIAQNPSLLNSVFKVEYKPTRNSEVDKLIHGGGSLAVDLLSCFEEKGSKPSFTAN